MIEQGGAVARSGHGFLLLENGAAALAGLCGGAALGALGAPLDTFERQAAAGGRAERAPLAGARGVRHAALLDLLRGHLPASTPIEAGVAVGVARDAHGRVRGVQLADGHLATAPLTVVADGARSRVRAALFPGHPLRAAGVVEIVAQVEDARWAAHLGRRFLKLEDRDRARAVGVLPAGGARLVWFVQLSAAEVPAGPLDPAARRALLAERLAGWAAPVPMLLDQTDFSQSYLWRAADLDPLPALHHDGVALVGDAGHPFLPFTSQGVSAALEDALALGAALDAVGAHPDTEDLSRALAQYSAARLPTVTRTLWAGRALQDRFLGGPTADGSADLSVPVFRP